MTVRDEESGGRAEKVYALLSANLFLNLTTRSNTSFCDMVQVDLSDRVRLRVKRPRSDPKLLIDGAPYE